MKEDKLRKIPLKNYLVLGIVVVVSLFLLYYFYMWVEAYNEDKLNRPILDRYMEVINYNELDDYLVENPDTILYISVLENSEIREFEKKLKGLFKSNQIEQKVLYLDLTEELKNKKIRTEILNKYTINTKSMLNVPMVMVIENGYIKKALDIKENHYDVVLVKDFINNVVFLDEDGLNG